MNFLIDLASHPAFQAGDVHTGFIDQHLDSLFPALEISENTLSQAVAAIIINEQVQSQNQATEDDCVGDPWTECDGFRINGNYEREFQLQANDKQFNIKLKYLDSNYEIQVDDSPWKTLSVKRVEDPNLNRCSVKMNCAGVESNFSYVITENLINIFNEVSNKLVR